MTSLLKIAGHVAVGVMMNQRAKYSQTRSLDGEEKMLRRVMATTKGGYFSGPVMGYLCVTTQAVRFEKSKTFNGRAVYGSIVLPLRQIQSAVAERASLVGSNLTLTVGGESHAFGLL